jgi:carboxylesterase type B
MAMYSTENSFTCHNRLVADGYAGKTYSVEYAVNGATHGADQSATFINPTNVSADAVPVRTAFQSYFVSFIRSGDPNKYRNKETIEWPLTTGFDKPLLSNVLKFEQPIGPKGSSLQDDPRQAKDRCAYWTDMQKAIEKKLASQKPAA